MLLSNQDRRITISSLLIPDSDLNDAGGSGGGPSNTQTPVAPQQDHSGQSDDNQASATNEGLTSQFDYRELGNRIENQVKGILEQRQSDHERNPLNLIGRRSRLSVGVFANQLELNRNDRDHLKEMVNTANFPTKYSGFKSAILTNHTASASLHNTTYRYDLINYIKNYKQ